MGLMQGLRRGLSAAGYAGADMYAKGALEDQRALIQAERDARLAEISEQASIRMEDRKRTQSAADGHAINDGAGEVNRARMAGVINSRNGSSMTADDAKVLENNPDAIKAYGMEPRSRSQEYDDKINVAEGRGLMAQAKELRGQQDIEIRRGSEERRLVADENRSKAAAAETARKEKHDEDWRKAQEAREATANRRLETILAGKSSGDKSEKVMSFMEGRRKEIASESSEIKGQMAADLKNAEFDPPEEKARIKAAYQPRLDAVAKERQQMDADFSHLRKKFDLPPVAESPKPAPSPVISKLPAGAKQVGTSGGKPVYEVNGQRFIQQ